MLTEQVMQVYFTVMLLFYLHCLVMGGGLLMGTIGAGTGAGTGSGTARFEKIETMLLGSLLDAAN